MENKSRAWVKHTTDHRWEWAYSMAEEGVKKNPDLEQNENDLRQDFLDKWDSTHNPDERITIKELMVYDNEVSISLDGKLTVRHGYEVLSIEKSTGLRDKNGKEIYEGDILKRVPCGTLYKVSYRAPTFTLQCLAENQFFGYRDFLGHTWEVIGNIHENPDLLS